MANKTSKYLKEVEDNESYYFNTYTDNKDDDKKDKKLSAFQRLMREKYIKPGGEEAHELYWIYMEQVRDDDAYDDELDRCCHCDDNDDDDDNTLE